MSVAAKKFVVGLRTFLAETSYEVFLYIALFAGLAAWWSFSSIYAGIAVFAVIGVIFGGAIYRFVQGQEAEKRDTSLWPLIFIAVVLISGTVTAFAWAHLPPIYVAVAVLLAIFTAAVVVYRYLERAKRK